MEKRTGPRAEHPPKTCENPHCGKTFTRKRYQSGKLEPNTIYAKRRYCNPECWEATRNWADYQPTQRELDMIEDVAWIVGTDTPERIAERVGYKNVDYLARTLRKCRQNELSSRLLREHSDYLNATPGAA